MAHQAHNIAWDPLTSNLRPTFPHHPCPQPCNFFVRNKPNQIQDITYFLDTFVNNIQEHTRCERDKYEKSYNSPGMEEVLVTDQALRRITPTILRARLFQEGIYNSSRNYDTLFGGKYSLYRRKLPIEVQKNAAPCRHDMADLQCGCVVPFRERQAAAFLRKYEYDYRRSFVQDETLSFFNMEVVKALILHNQMEPILRVCAHPDNGMQHWRQLSKPQEEVPQHDYQYHYDRGLGWEEVYVSALDAYLALNICYRFPELWDTGSGRTTVRDYRNTRLYQTMMRECTGRGDTSEMAKFPHRDFFGIEDGAIERYSYDKRPMLATKDGLPSATIPFPIFLARCRWYDRPPRPSHAAASYTRAILQHKGLPTEIVTEILDLADHKPMGRLLRPHNPLHVDNWEELRKYLTYCWQLVIRCDMMAREMGVDIPWRSLVISRLSRLLSTPSGGCFGKYDCWTDTWSLK
ncbi:hypothetical protein NQ176_g338 [Zarea fungicola]|uniref:Uncharacterized protein n=1 Tax=Zarea fungicola TaxID=93591 RepID=A0ACC1NYK2_9HYPO|nr:hypothetical protein NQ176_g338 [Lecanicillium fungicola]